jgi:hypothetical protein
MLDPNRPSRAHTPGALRARASRARLRDGIRTFKVRAHTRRLIFAMRRANPELSDELETLQEGLADASEANVGIHVVESDLAAAGHAGNPKNGIAICRNKHVVIGLRNPRAQVRRRPRLWDACGRFQLPRG